MSISTFLSVKNFVRTASVLTLVSFNSVINATPAQAIINGGFESNYSSWTTTGDTTIQPIFQGINPQGGSNQALITNACSDIAYTGAECFDTTNPTQPRNDDSPAAVGVFNFSDNDQTDANVENFGSNLQSWLGLDENSLFIPREGGVIPGNRTPKEGSAIGQTFTITEPSTISFDWNYLTNDGADSFFGNSDFAFLTIYETSSFVEDRSLEVLAQSSGAIPTLNSSDTEYANPGIYTTYESDILQPGTYFIGLGVVDVDGVNVSSALLVDNFNNTTSVPFEFSPTTGLAFVSTLFGFNYLRRRKLSK